MEEWIAFGDLLIAYTGSSTYVSVPRDMGPMRLTGIGPYALSPLASGISPEQRETRNGIKSVKIPGGITYIGVDAFACCQELWEVFLPEGLEVIESGAFALCSALEAIRIPKSVKMLHFESFLGCDSLRRLIIEGPETELDDMIQKSENTFRRIILNHAAVIAPNGSKAELFCRRRGIDFIGF